MRGSGVELWRQTGERVVMDAKYLLGIQEIDVQHSSIFSAIEPLQRASPGNGLPQPFVPALMKLRELLIDHFDFEESFMGSISCPDLQEHKQRHAEIRKLLEDCVSAVGQTAADGSLGRILGDRISSHLLEYDVKMGSTVEQLVAQLRQHESEEKR
jgi:hemerythrin-like metal-binding protein